MLGNSLQIMDLTCPSLLMDKLPIHDETSDYGSRESSDREPHIGGLCQLLFQKGIEWLFYSQLHEHLEFNNTICFTETTIFFRGNTLYLLDSENVESKGSKWHVNVSNSLLSLEELFVFSTDISSVAALDTDMVVICKKLHVPNFKFLSHSLAF